MENIGKANDCPRVFIFPEAVTIQTIESLAETIRQLQLLPGEMLTVDVEHTTLITTPGVQLILALAHTLEQNGGAFAISKIQPAFLESFNALGLSSRLMQWEITT